MIRADKHKIVWWMLLVLGTGGTLLFFALVAKKGAPPPRYWLRPVCTIALAGWSVFRLRRLYREKPLRGPGSWQLSLSDLIGAAIFMGVLLGAWRWCGEAYFLRPGLPMVSISGFVYVAGA